jgi:hypothetical protein
MKIENTSSNTQGVAPKKIWAKPEVFIIATDDVNSKNAPSLHEKTFVSSRPGIPGQHIMHFNKYSGAFPNAITVNVFVVS